MSKIEVDAIVPQSGTTLTVGESGDTITIPSGATFDASNATTTLPSTIVTTTGSQTLTNKTIDASQLTGTITPSDGTVTNAKIVDSTIQLAKLSATGTKDATTFLRGDNTFASVAGGTNTPAFLATMEAQSVSNDTYTVLAFNTEVVDTDSAYDNSTYTFTVPSGKAGLYYFTAMMQAEDVDDGERAQIVFAVDGSRNFRTMARNYSPGTNYAIFCTASSILNLSEGSTVVAQVLQDSGETQNVGYGQFGGFKIIT